MIKFKFLFFPLFIMVLIVSCRNDLKNEKYQRPEWLAGKVYTVMLEHPELSTFASCVERVGYDSIIDVSGSYTIFAPSNDAWNTYFASNPKYNSVDDIPIDELKRIVKYHVVQNPWSKIQLRTLDVYGWIDTLDLNNNKPRGFKRETLLLEKDTKYGVTGYKPVGDEKEKVIIVDTTKSIWHRRAITDMRKSAPIFYQEYFDIYKLNSSDYEFYFDRGFDSPNDIYFAGAKIISDEIFAENGFVYIVDKVVEPLNNAMEILTKGETSDQYKAFLGAVNLFPSFEYNDRKTMEQPGASEGVVVDSLFNLTFPDLTFNINAEKTSPPTGTYGLPQNVTIRYHHGFMAPTNKAFLSFIDQYIKVPGGWGTFAGMPDRIKKIIVRTYMSPNTIYPSDFEEGFYNGESDIVRLDIGDIAEKKFGSNCSFIGLNKAIVPRAFKSVTGPVYLKRGYMKVMYGIEESGLLAALKRENKEYMFFVEPDALTSQDSSFFYHPNPQGKPSFSVILRSPKGYKEFFLTLNDLRTMFLNQVATRQPKGLARKEFIPNLAGNYIIVNNETGEYSGTSATTEGYHGSEVQPEYPRVLSEDVDNGITYSVRNWFSFSGASLYIEISTSFPRFHELLRKAGLSNDKTYSYKFISDNEYYTVFVPNNDALDSAKVDQMPIDELTSFLKLHFVQGELIFTDGSSAPRYFETTRIDEKSTEYTKYYTKIYIEPDVDKITIVDKNGGDYVTVEEAEGKTNILTAVNIGKGVEVFPMMFNNGVIHEIDKAFNIEELDTK